MTTSKISIDAIKYDSEYYPREKPSSAVIEKYADALVANIEFPPIVLEKGSNKLLDGYHRWKAHKKIIETPGLFDDAQASKKFECIEAEFHEIPEGITPRLYAYSLSSKHGLQLTSSDAKTTAEEQYNRMPGTPLTTFCRYLGVSDKTAKGYISHLIARFEETKRTVITRLDMLGWTQQEIADKLQALWPDAKGTSRPIVTENLSEIGDFRISTKKEVEAGHKVETIAKRHELPEVLVWAMALAGADDPERTRKLGINVQPYDVWNFPKCHDLFGSKHPGRIPGEIVAHVLYFFTQPGDYVIDPMAGSGTTADVCLAFGRKCYAFDIDTRHDRPDIIQHNIAVDGWHERIKKANLIFWDPPYFEKMDSSNIGDEGYIEGSISKLPRDEYLSFFALRLTEAKMQVKRGTKIAFLMSDWDDNTDQREGIFVWDYAKLFQDAGWKLIRHIQVPLSTQQVHPDIVNKFRDSRRLARLERYLLVAEA